LTSMLDPIALKSRLLHTWTPFFARHGNFTPVQMAAIPPILDGLNVLVISATASGKTEAAIAPLLERHCLATNALAEPQLRILYICPTRALVRDLYERLKDPLEALHLLLSMKSGDTGPVSTVRPPTLLITTPESTDSLLTRAPRLLADLRAIVLDEIHLFDGGPRGDHLRCLLRRIEHVRRYRSQELQQPVEPVQRIALSATIPDPEGVAARYLQEESLSTPPQIVTVPGARQILAQTQPMHSLDDLVTALALRSGGTTAIRKSLIFCNTRQEVEKTAAHLRRHLPFEAAVFTHYSNLDPALRLEVENGFAEASVALCVSTSTLELGIDIGSIDDVVLVGSPPGLSSFLQRIGRGGRRSDVARVLCLPRSALEEVQFRALIELAATPSPVEPGASAQVSFLPSVLVQQTFSILKQSPTGALRLADLRRVAPEEVGDPTLQQILAELVHRKYLRPGRAGEWRPGPALDELVDAHEIYSNIGSDPLALQLVDAYSGRILAQTEQRLQVGETLQLGGHTLQVVWRDRYRVGVRRIGGGGVEDELFFRSAPFAVPLEVSQAVARHLGLAFHAMALVPVAEGSWLFHFWGDLYCELLAEILRPYFATHEEAIPVTPVNAHCLFLTGSLAHLPAWNRAAAQGALQRLLPRIEPFLEMGRFHGLLPSAVAQKAMIEQCNLPRFESLYQQATIVQPSSRLRAQLERLL
jgi:ATP-dependent helicase Lhr and Lhr-like helicase